jgi:hypothetical protein
MDVQDGGREIGTQNTCMPAPELKLTGPYLLHLEQEQEHWQEHWQWRWTIASSCEADISVSVLGCLSAFFWSFPHLALCQVFLPPPVSTNEGGTATAIAPGKSYSYLPNQYLPSNLFSFFCTATWFP